MTSPSPRQTKLQLITAQVKKIEEDTKWLAENLSSWSSQESQSIRAKTNERTKSVESDLPKLVQKASESNPDKRTYGKAMAEKILKLNSEYQAIAKQFQEISAKVLDARIPEARVQENVDKTSNLEVSTKESLSKPPQSSDIQDQLPSETEQKLSLKEPLENSPEQTRYTSNPQRNFDDSQPADLEQSSLSKIVSSSSMPQERTPTQEKTSVIGNQNQSLPSDSNKRDAGLQNTENAPSLSPITKGLEADFGKGSEERQKSEIATPHETALPPEKDPNLGNNTGPKEVSSIQAQSSQQQQNPDVQNMDEDVLRELKVMHTRWEEEGESIIMKSASDLLRKSPQTITGGGQELMQILQAAEKAKCSVLADFNTSWCGPCRAMKPLLVQAAEEFRGKVCIVMIDCEESQANRSLASEAAISAFPTFHLYFGLQRKHSFKGGKPYPALRSMLNEHAAIFHKEAKHTSKKGQMEKILQSLSSVADRASSAEYDEFCRLLQKILENIRDNATEQKFRSLKASNKTVQKSILSLSHSRELLQSIGFFPVLEAGSEVFYGTDIQMDVVKDSLELIKLSLKSSKSFAKFASGLLGNQERPSNDPAPASTSSNLGSGPGANVTNPENRPQTPSTDPNVLLLAQQLAQVLSQAPGQG